MMNKLFNVSTMPLLGMVFLFMAACSDDADNSDPNNDIQNIEMPSSGAESPIVSGKLVVIRGNGFSENSEIWFQTSSRSDEKKADVISYSDESISFIAPNMTGNCDVILRQEGKEKTLGQMFLEEKDVDNMNDYTYAAGYNVVDFEDNENAFPILYVFDRQSGDFEKKNELPNGEIIKFILAENNGNQNIYYFKRCLPISKEVSLYKYNLAKQEEKKVCANWLNKFYNASPGMAIGMIENTLCGLEASVDKGFEIVSFDDNGKTTLLKEIIASNVVQLAEVLIKYGISGSNFVPRKVESASNASYTEKYYEIPEEISKYGILVVSNNNGAVENITLDLPKSGDMEKDKTRTDYFDRKINKEVYFSALADNLLGKEGGAWGLISARMGRKSYVTEVLESCVFAKKMMLRIK